MGESLFCPAQKVPTLGYRIGYFRTFKGYPALNKEVWDLIQELKTNPRKILLFFLENVTDDAEYANFLAFDVLNGVWNG